MGRKKKSVKQNVAASSPKLTDGKIDWFADADDSRDNITVNDVCHIPFMKDEELNAREEAKADKLERDLIFNKIILAIIDAHPVSVKKTTEGARIARLLRVRRELLGETLTRGRHPRLEQEKLDLIARKYFQTQFDQRLSEEKVKLDPILKDVLLPNWKSEKPAPTEVENAIKTYRKTFKKDMHWLLMRNTGRLDLMFESGINVNQTLKDLLYLTKKPAHQTYD